MRIAVMVGIDNYGVRRDERGVVVENTLTQPSPLEGEGDGIRLGYGDMRRCVFSWALASFQ